MEGSGHSVDISQTGSENFVVGVDQGAFLIGGENNSFVVVQEGNANLVEGSIIGSNNAVMITQIGDGNIATVTQE